VGQGGEELEQVARGSHCLALTIAPTAALSRRRTADRSVPARSGGSAAGVDCTGGAEEPAGAARVGGSGGQGLRGSTPSGGERCHYLTTVLAAYQQLLFVPSFVYFEHW